MHKHRHLFITFLAICSVLIPLLAHAATAKCPPYSVTLTGTSQMPGGTTYTETLTMHKETGGGFDGTWKITKFVQENTYTHRVDFPMPIVAASQPDFGDGQSMTCVAHTAGKRFYSECVGGNTTMDVVGGKIGWKKKGYWIGKIAGNQMELKFHKENPHEPVIKGAIQKLQGGTISLTITQPTDKQNYVYSEVSPGTFTITAEAKAQPASNEGDIAWTLPEIAGSKRTVTPASAKGRSVKVEYSDLPKKNASFGKKTIKATLDIGACKVNDEKKIAVFFPRDATNNPGGKEPNWFYYWKQTSACSGPAKYAGSTGACGKNVHSHDGTIGYYRNRHLEPHYYICDLKDLGPDFSFMTVRIDPIKMFDNAKVTGIDTFAAACHHENAHYSHFKKWWFKHRAASPFSPAEDMNKNSIKDSKETVLDKDADLLPDSEEPALGFNPKTKFTIPKIPDDDEEVLTWKEEAQWTIGSANKEDWAKPGKQWK